MAITVEETYNLARGDGGNDPLFDEATGAHRIHKLPFGLYLKGYDEDGQYADDLLVMIHNDGWLFWSREPYEGKEWLDGGFFSDWSDLVGWAYSL